MVESKDLISSGVNAIVLIGNVGKDPEIRRDKAGHPVATFTLATTEVWKKDGVRQEKTEWHNIVAFGDLTKTIEEHVLKGRLLYIEGRLQTRKWGDPIRYTTEVVINRMRVLNPK